MKENAYMVVSAGISELSRRKEQRDTSEVRFVTIEMSSKRSDRETL